jgi:hypothetical protein
MVVADGGSHGGGSVGQMATGELPVLAIVVLDDRGWEWIVKGSKTGVRQRSFLALPTSQRAFQRMQ